jgi:hypothetical protein
METTHEIKKAAVIAAAAEQVRSLLETHYDAMRKAAEESFVDDDTQSEPKAKASFTIEWDALAMAPTVSVKVGWRSASRTRVKPSSIRSSPSSTSEVLNERRDPRRAVRGLSRDGLYLA